MKIIKKIFAVLLSGVVLFIVYLVIISLSFGSKQQSYPSIDQIDIDPSATQNFANAIKIRTVSPENADDFDSTQFDLFSNFLETSYPLTDSLLEKIVFNNYSYLYKWEGTDHALKPVILMGHLDVVPVIEENIPDWREAPFGGEIVTDTIWGRGAIDDKIGVIGLMESMELLLKQGFSPKRTLYVAFGHDEELGGLNGAKVIANHLVQQGVKAEFVLDEGGTIIQGMIPGIEQDVAIVGIAEKGFVSLELSVKLTGGHSSMPEKETAIDVLSFAITKLKANPFPGEISAPLEGFIDYVGPEMPFASKLVFANRAVLKPLILKIYEQKASTNALVRTTTSPTIFNSGVKENIIPQSATATVNFRILPGSTIASVIDRVRETINDDRISIETTDFSSEPSKTSSTNTLAFETIGKTIAEVYPGVLLAPYLVVGGTDSRHYSELSENIYRFLPTKINKGNIKSFHGINERLAISDFENGVRFYTQLIKNSTAVQN